ncbi:hypothetical protein H8M03_09355 [Sphingomonas sabuli]|uniref:Transmembrane protein n=1 Tax=Sphingomonas sabuli TaxID=2764186 RepID=A0A7G9L0S5_9SPHN|nr:hypothetical protein [Sphingomonas sabuli]QNM82224.1 hypothetical protein H8M03_09355 [Sphingomonas sabuli]
MIDDDSHVDPRSVSESERFDEALQYDFAKFLTTLALLAFGGVLTLTQTARPGAIKLPVVAVVIAMIVVAGILSVSAAGRIAAINLSDHKGPTAKKLLQGSLAFLGAGAGGLVVMLWVALR